MSVTVGTRMKTRARPVAWLLPLALTLGGCIRWGVVPVDESEVESEDSSEDTNDTLPPETDTGEETDDSSDDPWPEPLPIDPDARVVAWGKTGIPTRNLEMFANIFVYLAGDGTPAGDGDGDMTTGDGDGDMTTGDGDGDMTTGDGDGDTGGGNDGSSLNLLWVSDCDPREDALGCLAGNIQPFFDMVDTLGTIDFVTLASVDPAAYDVVIADFCGPITPEQVGLMLGDGAHVLVLGDTWCVREEQTSAELANQILEPLGARFNGELLYNHDFLVSDAKQVDLLEGVPTIDVWGLSLQDHTEPVVDAVSVLRGALLTSR